MADNVLIDQGVGTSIATEDVSGVQHQKVKVEFGGDGVATLVSSSNPLPVDVISMPAVTVDTTGLATDTNQTNGSQKTQIVDVGGEAATVTGGKLDVNASIDTTGLATSAKQDTGNTSLASIDGKITAVNTGAVVVSSSALPTGASTAAKQPALGTAGTPSADVITVQGIASMTALKVDGSAVTQPVSGTFYQATQPVSIASAVPVTDNSGSLTVDAPVGTPAFVRLSDGAAAITTLPVSLSSVPSHAVTNAGTFAVQVDGSALTSLQLADDVVATLGTTTYTEASTKGTTIGAVRRDADTTLVDTTNEIGPLQMDANGRLKVEVFSGETLPISGSVTTSGTVTATLAAETTKVIGTVNQGTSPWVTSNATTSVVGNGAAATAQRVTLANDSTGIVSLTTSTASIGKLASNTGVTIGAVEIAASQTLGTVTTLTGGGIAHDGVDSGNPHKMGARARTSEIAAVASDDRTDLVATTTGKLIVETHTNPENIVSGVTAAMTGTTSTSLVAAPAGSLRNYITTLTVSNSHATVGTDVEIQDGSGGTTIWVIPAAAVYGGGVVSFDPPLRQPTAATALYVKNTTTGASTRVSANGYKAL